MSFFEGLLNGAADSANKKRDAELLEAHRAKMEGDAQGYAGTAGSFAGGRGVPAYGASYGGAGRIYGSDAPYNPAPALNADEGDPRRGMLGTGSSADERRPSGGLMTLLDKHEGGGRYDTLFAHAQRDKSPFQGVDVSRMTLGELDGFASTKGAYGNWVKGKLGESGQEARIATPMGRFQIVGRTLRRSAQQLGLPKDTVFDAKTQTQIASHLARQRLSGQKTMSGKLSAMRSEWEGFKHVSDRDLALAIDEFEKGRGAF